VTKEAPVPPQPDYRDLWRQASAEAIFNALIPGWKAVPRETV